MEIRIDVPDELATTLRRTPEELQYDLRLRALAGLVERGLLSTGRAAERDELLWLLSGIASILDVRCFFFHLREECAADRDRIRRAKRLLGRMRAQTYELREQLKYCSPLGAILRSVQRTDVGGTGPTVGVGTIRRLKDAGISNLTELARLKLPDLLRLGIRRDLAKQISTYMRRRLQ